MFVDSYQVEIQNSELAFVNAESLVTQDWITDRCFCPQYKWRCITRRIWGGLFRRIRQEIVGDPLIQALIVKSDAHRYAQSLMRVDSLRSVRITRIEREGARLVKFVIWRDGKWLE